MNGHHFTSTLILHGTFATAKTGEPIFTLVKEAVVGEISVELLTVRRAAPESTIFSESV